jgi:hypothetical protein
MTRPASSLNAVEFQHHGAGRLGMPGQCLVEAQPRADQPIIRKIAQVRPGQFKLPAAGNQPQPAVPAPAGRFLVRQAQQLHLAHRARRQAVAADLFPREGGLFQHGHVHTGRRQVVRRCGSCRTGPNNQN